MKQIQEFLANALSSLSTAYAQIDAGILRPSFNWFTDNDPQTFYRSLKLSLLMYLLTTVTLGVVYRISVHGIEKRAEARRLEEQNNTLAPFRSVLVSRLVSAQHALFSALSE